MYWIFALAIIMPIDVGLCDTTATAPVNLTTITWDHAVNSQNKLKDALASKLATMDANVLDNYFQMIRGSI